MGGEVEPHWERTLDRWNPTWSIWWECCHSWSKCGIGSEVTHGEGLADNSVAD